MIDVLRLRLDDAHAGLRRQVGHLKHAHHLEGLANALDTSAALAVARKQWETAAGATAAAHHLRLRLCMAPWPLIREYHDSLEHLAREHLGDRAPTIENEAIDADPWAVINNALDELPGSTGRGRSSDIGSVVTER